VEGREVAQTPPLGLSLTRKSAGLPARRSGMPNRGLVVDTNTLVRAVLGKRVRGVIEAYAEGVAFFVPGSCVLRG
jgi:hypothetical protein